MQVGDLRLEDFRNYEREQVEFAPGLNLIVGRNAQGKTNLLEAVHCLSGLGSPRGSDAALVRAGAERALLHAKMARGDRWIEVDMEFRPGRGTRALINKVPTPRTRNLGELVVTVFFGPDELSLVKGSPDGRRRFLDELVVKLRPAREQLRRDWERVLKQRNALLKTALRGRGRGGPQETLEVWDDAFIQTGATLAAARLDALAALIPYATKRYEEVAGRGSLGLDYVSSWVSEEVRRDSLATGRADTAVLEECLRARLDQLATAELERGLSLAGPQRDDVSVQIPADDGSGVWLDARTFASQGDQRTAALALKLAEHDLLTDALGQHPILLLDDVFSELDPHRKTWLAEAVREMGQTLLSSAEPPTGELRADRVLQVARGRVSDG
ncbi:MAG TPA: DNA replication and repair protein RecF [Actinomycetota bacterium]|nr:DNA replication and repair protein RecF [Actinomycetota bacterium]